MKHHKQTDRIIKEKVEQYSTETPMHLFDGIMDALDIEDAPAPKENPSRRNWLLSLLAIVLIGGGTWYGLSGNKTQDASIEKLTVNLDEKNQNTITNNVIANESIVTTEKNNNENSNTETQFSNTITAATNDVQNATVNTATTSIATSNSNNLSTSTNNNNNTFSNSSFSKTIQNLENETTIQNTSTSNLNSKKDQLMEKGGSFNNSTSIPQSSIINSTSNISNETTTTASTLENKKATTRNNKVIASRSTSKESVLLLPDLKSTQRLSRNSEPYKIDVEPRCGLKPDGSKIRFTTSVDAFFSPDYAVQMLEYKSEDFRDHAEMRTNSESPFYSFNTGVRVNFLLETDWALRTGIVYTQINDILKTTHREVVIQLNSVGDTISVTEGTREVNIRNRYKMVDIPVIIGYEVPMKRFTLNVNGGVYVNIQSKQSGAFFSPLEDKIVYFTEGHPDDYNIFRNNVGLSAFLGLGFNFDLGKKTQLIVEPHTRFYPKSFTMKNYILNQKYLSTGVMIGLRRDL